MFFFSSILFLIGREVNWGVMYKWGGNGEKHVKET